MKKIIITLLFLRSSIFGDWSENISQASDKFGIPKDILYAIMKVESGFKPWSIHINGNSYFFSNKTEAVAFALESQRKGQHGLNLGLMQIYWPVHKNAFKDIEETFDPQKNICFAAQFLQKLKCELGSWEKAVKAYHSRIEKYGDIYGKRISQALGYPLESIIN